MVLSGSGRHVVPNILFLRRERNTNQQHICPVLSCQLCSGWLGSDWELCRIAACGNASCLVDLHQIPTIQTIGNNFSKCAVLVFCNQNCRFCWYKVVFSGSNRSIFQWCLCCPTFSDESGSNNGLVPTERGWNSTGSLSIWRFSWPYAWNFDSKPGCDATTS